ncbi:MAG: DUF1659 domain-containing protein [Clostridiaceae bacterium]
MAETVMTSQALVIRYKAGMDAEGKDVFKKQTFSNISNTATDDNLSIVGHAIGNILNTEIYSVLKENEFELFA